MPLEISAGRQAAAVDQVAADAATGLSDLSDREALYFRKEPRCPGQRL
jgi:hypothetical protein